MKNISSHYRILRNVRLLPLCVLAAALPSLSHAAPTGSMFTYQGRLNISGAPATDGVYDFRFTLHDASDAGSGIGSAVIVNALGVTNGLFTAPLDFGSTPFTSGEARWLQLQVNTNGVAPLVTLNPRQRITPTPQAIYAENAAMASAVAAGAVTSAGIAPAAVDSDSIQNGSIEVTDLSPSLFNETFWKLGGNTGAGSFLGTLNNQPLELRVNNQPALRLLPNAISPNIVGGHAANSVNIGGSGAFIGGGGSSDDFNVADGNYATVVGGQQNHAFGDGTAIGGGISNRVDQRASVVSGGTLNAASRDFATVGGGSRNSVVETNGTIGGGSGNFVSGNRAGSTIGGGMNNYVLQVQAGTIAGGLQNHITGNSSSAAIGGGYQNFIETNGFNGTIGGGYFNLLTYSYAVIGGGHFNSVHGDYSTVAGGSRNHAVSQYASIGGGSSNLVEETFGTVSGGHGNRAGRRYSTVAGGGQNSARSTNSTVSGGLNNDVSGDSAAGATISGGVNNYIRDSQAGVIAGGLQNHISGSSTTATVGGGYQNFIEAGSDAATIQGGFFNLITSGDYSSIGGGSFNTNSSNYSTVPGGTRNAATGDYALAAGRRAKASHNGSFVWADDTDADFASTTNKQFAVRANNGVMIQSSATAVDLRGGGAVRVEGAGVGTTTPVFIHRATAANIGGHITTINHPHCNGDPNAILIVTQNWNPGGGIGTYNAHPIAVYYAGSAWNIFNQDFAAMPVNAAFNVMVFKP